MWGALVVVPRIVTSLAISLLVILYFQDLNNSIQGRLHSLKLTFKLSSLPLPSIVRFLILNQNLWDMWPFLSQ